MTSGCAIATVVDEVLGNHTGRIAEAAELLRQATRSFSPTNPDVAVARKLIAGERPMDAANPALIGTETHVYDVTIAVRALADLFPEEQVVAASGRPDMTVNAYLQREVRAACERLEQFVPVLTVSPARPEEDRLTELVALLLRVSLRPLGWDVESQSMGGFTGTDPRGRGRGGIGERDLKIAHGENVLAIGEAVVVESAAPSQIDDVVAHFGKMFGYERASLFFLLVYTFTEDAKGVMSAMRDMARSRAPAGFGMRSLEELPVSDADHGVRGFISVHDGPRGPIRVVHLVVDFEQKALRSAAAAARG